MIKISFIGPMRKIIKFEIEGGVIKYFDDMWKKGIQIIPKDKAILGQLMISRRENLKMMAALILDANKGKNLREYRACKTEEDLANMIRKDCKSKGLIEIK